MNKIRKCIICGIDISETMGKRKVCKSEDCNKKLAKIKALEKKYIIVCKICGNEFETNNNRNKTCSAECHKKLRSVVMKEAFGKNKIEKSVICRQCGIIIDKVFRCKTKKCTEIFDLCNSCKDENKKHFIDKIKNRMLSDENPSIQRFGRKEKIILSDEEKLNRRNEVLEKMKKRMRENNPMFSENTRKKVSETFKSKKQNLASFKKYNKKMQTIYGYIRMGLGLWVRKCMERDEFKCTVCGCGGELHVHHNESFISILKRFIKENNILDSYKDKFNYDDNFHLKLREDVINYH